MNSNDFLEIRYDAFTDNDGLEDFKNIELFQEEVNKNYNNIVKGNPVGRGGGAYEFVIHFICDLHLLDYFNQILIVYLGGKILDKSTEKLLEKYLFIPLQNSYKKLKIANPIIDCYSFQIELKDANIFIYKTSNNSIFSNFDKIIQEITKNIEIIQEIKRRKITEIHIPAILDTFNEQKLYRSPLGELETKNLSDKDYFRFWGVKYNFNQLGVVYDLNSKSILSGCRFYSEKEFSVHFKKKYI